MRLQTRKALVDGLLTGLRYVVSTKVLECVKDEGHDGGTNALDKRCVVWRALRVFLSKTVERQEQIELRLKDTERLDICS